MKFFFGKKTPTIRNILYSVTVVVLPVIQLPNAKSPMLEAFPMKSDFIWTAILLRINLEIKKKHRSCKLDNPIISSLLL